MKFAWLLFICALVHASSEFLESIGASVGESCDAHSVFVVSNFGVTPFPVTPGVQLTLTMAGTFNRAIYVANIATRSSYNKGHWDYHYTDIDQAFAYGQIYTFTFTMTSGTGSGEYLQEVFLEEKQGKGISCWTFTYHL